MTAHSVSHDQSSVIQGRKAPFWASWWPRAAEQMDNWLAWRHDYRMSMRELSALSDRDLDDIGIARCDIRSVARRSADQASARRR